MPTTGHPLPSHNDQDRALLKAGNSSLRG
jgi:hypothetical protein